MLYKEEIRVGFVEFEKVEDARDIFTFFNSGSRISKNKSNGIIRVVWGYNRLYADSWAAVILRCIPPSDANIKNIYMKCTSRGEKVKHVVNPMLLKNQWCCIVVMETIEDAEKLCIRINNSVCDRAGHKVKAHIHPKSDMHRPNKGNSFNTLFQYVAEHQPKDYIEPIKRETQEKSLQIKKFIKKNKKPLTQKMINKSIRDSLISRNPDDEITQSDFIESIKIWTKREKSKYKSAIIRLDNNINEIINVEKTNNETQKNKCIQKK